MTKKYVRGRHLLSDEAEDEAIHYFDVILPQLKKEGKLQYIECIQHPGETIFVPGTWWHGVLNLDDTVAVTENFCNDGNFDKVWVSLREGRKKLSVLFLRKLKERYPELYDRALELNERDGFVMWDEREEFKHYFNKKRAENESSSSTWSSSSSDSSSSSSDEKPDL